jgi:hypothetical protein
VVNVEPIPATTQSTIYSGNITSPADGSILLATDPTSGSGFLRISGASVVNVTPNGNVWIGDSSTFNGDYAVLLGRAVTNNGSDGNVLIGFGANAGGGSVRDSLAIGVANLNGSVIGHEYGDFTGAMGFGLSAKQRNALNTNAIHLERLPGQWTWDTGTASWIGATGYANDAAFYSNYVGRNATTPSGATAGSFYSQPGGNLMIAGSVGYNYVDPLLNYPNDAAAAAAGVVIGQTYHNAGAVRVRII